MTRPLAPAEVPVWAWTALRELEALRGRKIELLTSPQPTACPHCGQGRIGGPRSAWTRRHHDQVAAVTREILAREIRLAAVGVDALGRNIAGDPLPAHTETEH